MAVSAASDDPQRQYNQAQMDDMTQEERKEAMLHQEEEEGTRQTSRSSKLGKAFQNWRRVQLKFLHDMQRKKFFFVSWQRVVQGENMLCMQDLIWTEDDMDHFLMTVASLETHKRLWKEKGRSGRIHLT